MFMKFNICKIHVCHVKRNLIVERNVLGYFMRSVKPITVTPYCWMNKIHLNFKITNIYLHALVAWPLPHTASTKMASHPHPQHSIIVIAVITTQEKQICLPFHYAKIRLTSSARSAAVLPLPYPSGSGWCCLVAEWNFSRPEFSARPSQRSATT